MIHPMLLMRDPPPEIDVTRPALPKRIRLADLTGGVTSETVDNTAPLSQYITESAAPCKTCGATGSVQVETRVAIDEWDTHDIDCPKCDGTGEESAAQVPQVSESAHAATEQGPVAVDRFKAGDRSSAGPQSSTLTEKGPT